MGILGAVLEFRPPTHTLDGKAGTRGTDSPSRACRLEAEEFRVVRLCHGFWVENVLLSASQVPSNHLVLRGEEADATAQRHWS